MKGIYIDDENYEYHSNVKESDMQNTKNIEKQESESSEEFPVHYLESTPENIHLSKVKLAIGSLLNKKDPKVSENKVEQQVFQLSIY